MPSTAELVLKLTGKDESASAALDKVNAKADAFGTSIRGVASIASGFVLGAGLTKAADYLGDAAKAAAEDEASQIRLQKAVENTGVSWKSVQGQIEAVIKKGQDLAFTDDQTRESLSLLAAQTG